MATTLRFTPNPFHLRPMRTQSLVHGIRSSIRTRWATYPNCLASFQQKDASYSVGGVRSFSSKQPLRRPQKPPPSYDKFVKRMQNAQWRVERNMGRAWREIEKVQREEPDTSSRARKVARLRADSEYMSAKYHHSEVVKTWVDEANPAIANLSFPPSFERATEVLLSSTRNLITAKRKSVLLMVLAPLGEVSISSCAIASLSLLSTFVAWGPLVCGCRAMLWGAAPPRSR